MKRLLDILHSRAFNVAVALLAVAMAAVFFFTGHTELIDIDKGLVLPSANLWFKAPLADFTAGVAGTLCTVALMMALNKVYNVLRTMTSLYIGLFALMQLAAPDLMTQFYTGTALALVVPVCVLVLLGCYASPDATRRIFLIFLILSAFTATQYSYMLYIPVFLIGCAQMRIFSIRTLLASFMGLLTPWVIMAGFGIVDLTTFQIPQFESIFSIFDADDAFFLILTQGLSILVLLVCHLLNLMKTIAYNARSRATNGLFVVLAFFTVAAMCVDYRNFISYVPVLNICAAFGVAHYLSTHRSDKSAIPIIILMAAYAALFICQTVI